MKVIEDGKILFRNNRLLEAQIGIKNGKIHKIKKTGLNGEKIDAKGCIVLPSGIDLHAHFRDFKEKHKETWKTGTKSAAAGAITTAVDQPNTDPPVKTTKIFKRKKRKAEKNSYIDFGINGLTTKDSDLKGLAQNKITAFGETFFPQKKGLGLGKEEAKEILETIKDLKKLVYIHAEDQEIIEKAEKTIKNQKPKSFLNKRPKKAEVSAIKQILRINEGTELHFCHLTTSEGVELVSNTKYTSEITPHHLFFKKSDFRKKGAFLKTNPPIRDRRNRKKLWKQFKQNKIPIMASDHAPHTRNEKDQEFDKAPAGIPGIETMYPMMNYQVKRKNISLKRLVQAISKNPAQLLGLDKGEIREGKDADLAIFDFNDIREVDPKKLHTKCDWTPFKNKKAIFPKKTLLRGKIIWKNGSFPNQIGEMICTEKLNNEK